MPYAKVPTPTPGLEAWYWIDSSEPTDDEAVSAANDRDEAWQPEWGLPLGGHWTLTHARSDMGIGHRFVGLHAVLYAAMTLADLADWTVPASELASVDGASVRRLIEAAETVDIVEDEQWCETENGPSVSIMSVRVHHVPD